jgi:predicted type IV restriction endonuclease
MTLDEELAEAQTFYAEPPPNESCTCEWIILPLLEAIGYLRRERLSRSPDSNGQFPDYTLLPGQGEATWYLEAKAWNVSLEDRHAQQALNYANQNGKRFVVLTNGHLWRLYDNEVRGVLADKLIAEVSLRDTQIVHNFLSRLSKQSVLSGGLTHFVIEEAERKKQQSAESEVQERQKALYRKLDAVLPELLEQEDSELLRSLTLSLNQNAEFADLSVETLARWFGDHFRQPTSSTSIPAPFAKAQVAEKITSRTLSLEFLQRISVDGKNTRPSAVIFPDGTQAVTLSWVNLAEQTIRWLMRQEKRITLPFVSKNPKRYFLNIAPVHRAEELRCKFQAINENRQTIYMDKDWAGSDFLRYLHALCLQTQVSPSDIRITLE